MKNSFLLLLGLLQCSLLSQAVSLNVEKKRPSSFSAKESTPDIIQRSIVPDSLLHAAHPSAQKETGIEQDSLEKNKKKSSRIFQPKGKFSSLLYSTIQTAPRNVEEEQRILAQENAYLSQFEGRTIGEIYVYRNDVFEGSEKWVDRTLDKLHYLTREEQIRKDLFVHRGDRFDANEISLNRRLIRSRRYLTDVNILVVPQEADTSRVDIYLITRDKWTISANFQSDSDGKSFLELYDDNFLGYGSQLSVSTYFDYKHAFRYGGNLVKYSLTNIKGTFWDGNVTLGQGFDNADYGLEVQKEFIRPTDYSAGAAFHYRRDLIDVYPLDTSIHASWTMLDVWGGKTFGVNRYKNSLYLTGRLFNLHHTNRPEVNDRLNPYFFNTTMALASVGVYREQFRLARRIYGYGVIEDVAYGYRAGFVTGHAWDEFGKRWYLGGEFSAGYFTKIGYLGIKASLGSYLNRDGHQFYRTAFSGQINYFTNLLGHGRYPVRQFLTLNVTRGWNRLNGFREMLEFNDNADLRCLTEDVYGTNRVVLNTETVVFTPWRIYQFQIAMFGFADFGLLGDNGNCFKNDFYTTLGLGVRIKNEHLIFKTINIRLGVALKSGGLAQSSYFNLSSRDRTNDIRYIPQKLAPIQFL